MTGERQAYKRTDLKTPNIDNCLSLFGLTWECYSGLKSKSESYASRGRHDHGEIKSVEIG